MITQRRAATGHNGERGALAGRIGLALRFGDDDRGRSCVGSYQPVGLVPSKHTGAGTGGGAGNNRLKLARIIHRIGVRQLAVGCA